MPPRRKKQPKPERTMTIYFDEAGIYYSFEFSTAAEDIPRRLVREQLADVFGDLIAQVEPGAPVVEPCATCESGDLFCDCVLDLAKLN